jgi:proteasome lid subunit RPN8/RPN11
MLSAMNVGPNLSNESATTVEHSSERGDPSRPLVLSDVLRREIVTHLQAWIPNEGCGLLASVPHGDVDRAVHFFPGTNIDRSPVRYTMDPVEVIGAMRRMRDEAWTLAAIVHSHPRTPPLPSRTDLREAYYPDARLIIVSFAMPVPELRCWRLSSDAEAPGFVESQLLSG